MVLNIHKTFGNRCLKSTEHRENCSGTFGNVSGGSGRFPEAYGSIRWVKELSKPRKPTLDQVGRSTRS